MVELYHSMKWKILHKGKSKSVWMKTREKVKSEQKDTQIQTIIKTLLENRGLKGKKDIEEFLHPKLQQLQAPFFDKKELDVAIIRIQKAIKNKEKIIVYSDYDADGITGAAILWETLHALGSVTLPYMPNRMDEGYGLSVKGIDNMLVEHPDTKLIITVDHGITAAKQVQYAREKGIDVIITDHHTIPVNRPKPLATIHTTKLAGSGVALLFSAILKANNNNTLLTAVSKVLLENMDHVSLAALGTIADLVPLIGVNRVVAKFGLAELNKTKRVGLQALIEESGLKDKKLGTYDVSYMLAPRINASGRLTDALDSLRLLCTTDPSRGKILAAQLGSINTERKTIMENATDHAKSIVRLHHKLIFVVHESYHEGVIGLVAGRLVEQYWKPAIVIARKEGFSKASARSVPGYNIIEAIRTAGELLVDCGGHPMAAGFTIATEKIEQLEKQLSAHVEETLSDELLTRELRVDMELSFDGISKGLYVAIQEFQPFGIGNPEPVFSTCGVTIRDARTMGVDGKHLKLVLVKDGATFEAVGFGMGQLYPKLSSDKPIDLVYTITTNTWNGQEKIQLKTKEIKTCV